MESRLTGTVHEREAVGSETLDRLHRLFERYYAHAGRAVFDRDWEEKDWVLLLRDHEGEVQGFTTLKLYDLEAVGRRVRAVFSGNTIIDQAYWGEQEMARCWGRFMAELKMREPAVPLYWYLISSGYRTYLYLPLFFKEFYPRHDRAGDCFEKELSELLGRMKFPDEYRDGVVRVSAPRECLRPDLAVPPPARLRNPHVRFFVERNPGYLRGDELVCLAEFSLENALRTARQALLEAALVPC